MRTFLLTALKRFMINQYEKATAAKRGSGVPPFPLDFGWVQGRFLPEPGHSLTPDVEFERQWALRILDLAFDLAKQEAEARGRAELFSELQGLISMDAAAAPYAETGPAMCWSPNTTWPPSARVATSPSPPPVG